MEDANWTVEKVDNTWNQYNMREEFLSRNGLSSGSKSIVKDDKNVAILSEDYKLLPNEEMVAVSDDVGKMVGAVPFDKFTGQWFCRVKDHVFLTGENQAQAHALYAFNEPFDIGGGDTIQLGFAVHNSIDGSMGFQIGAFTFRHACANMVFLSFQKQKKGQKNFDDREVLASIYKKHTKSLEIDRVTLSNAMLQVIEASQGILRQYKLWREEELKLEAAKRLVGKMPKKYIPAYINIDEETEEVSLLRAPSVWETYNDITAAIWHNEESQYSAKKIQFDNLHKALSFTMIPDPEAKK